MNKLGKFYQKFSNIVEIFLSYFTTSISVMDCQFSTLSNTYIKAV